MKVTHRTEKYTTLVLNEEQATWLSAMVQNKLHERETNAEREIRTQFWNALNPSRSEEL